MRISVSRISCILLACGSFFTLSAQIPLIIMPSGTITPFSFNHTEEKELDLKIPVDSITMLNLSAELADDNFTDLSLLQNKKATKPLDALYLSTSLSGPFSLRAGYFNPTVTQNSESLSPWKDFNTDEAHGIAPSSVWFSIDADFLGGTADDPLPMKLRFATIPDYSEFSENRTGLQGQASPYLIQKEVDPTIPNLFGSLWFQRGFFTGEAAAILKGSALSYSGLVSWFPENGLVDFNATAGARYIQVRDNELAEAVVKQDNEWSFHGGLNAALPWNGVTLDAGVSFKTDHASNGIQTQTIGFDAGVTRDNVTIYAGFISRNPDDPLWGSKGNTGGEAGVKLSLHGIDYLFGYTVSGFSLLSSQYTTAEWSNGGPDGIFLRIKALQW